MKYLDPEYVETVFISPTRKRDYDNDNIRYKRNMYVVIKKKYRKYFSELKWRSYFDYNDAEGVSINDDDCDTEVIFTGEDFTYNLIINDSEIESLNQRYIKWSLFQRNKLNLPIILSGSASTLAKLKLML